MTGLMTVWGASLAVALLILFTAVLVVTLARGKAGAVWLFRRGSG